MSRQRMGEGEAVVGHANSMEGGIRRGSAWRILRVAVPMAAAALLLGLLLTPRPGPAGVPGIVDMKVLSLNESYPLALASARQWNSDVHLSAASFRVVPKEAPAELLRASFSLESPSQPGWYFFAVVDQGDDLVVSEAEAIERQVERPPRKPIDPAVVPLDSLEALELIMQYGGSQYLVEHGNPKSPPMLVLEYEDIYYSTGPLLWRASFLAVDGTSARIAIGALTGDLVEKRINEPPG